MPPWQGEIMRAAEAWRPRPGRSLIRRISPLAFIATLAIFLSACGSAFFEAGSCPTWPEAGSAVALEVERWVMPLINFQHIGSGWGVWTSCVISF